MMIRGPDIRNVVKCKDSIILNHLTLLNWSTYNDKLLFKHVLNTVD